MTGREFADGEGPIVVQAIGSSDRKVLVSRGLQPHLLATGHLIFLHNGTLFAVRFDPQRLETTGETVPLLAGLSHSSASSAGQFAISDNGLLVYADAVGLSTIRQLVAVDRRGIERPLGAPVGSHGQIRLSPDRTRLVLSSRPNMYLDLRHRDADAAHPRCRLALESCMDG
jgi:serine/threonine-protein kinase